MGSLTMTPKIVIEYEEPSNSEPVLLRLSIDNEIIAGNLTPEEMRRLVVRILERMAALDIEEDTAQPWATEFVGTRRH
jgi:hypothetical protein